MQIDYSCFFKDISDRTIRNLDYIIENKDNDELYEVVQAINSMYCLLVVPEEIFGVKPGASDSEDWEILRTELGSREKRLQKYEEYRTIKGIIDELRNTNRLYYKSIDIFVQECPVGSFIYNIRNALCHDGIGFSPIQEEAGTKKKNKIEDIIFEARNKEGNSVKFLTVLSTEVLNELIRSIASLYARVEDGKRNSNEKAYNMFFGKLKKDADELLPNWRQK